MFSVQQERQRGITLLEVLISIGILAIGLVSTLALLPAGGAYLKKASTDNRAAALVHNAVNTMRASGLFKENAIYWGEGSENKTDGENQVRGFPLGGRDGERNVTVPETYAISGTWSPRDIEPTLSGTVVRNDPDPAVDDDYVVFSATCTGQRGVGTTIAELNVPLVHPDPDFDPDDPDLDWDSGITFYWSYTPPLTARSPSPELFEIYDEKSEVDSNGDWREFWYDEWDFNVTHNDSPSDINVVPPPTPARPAAFAHPGGNPNSPSNYAHFLPRPRHRIARGEAMFDFMLKGHGGTNQTTGSATNLRFLPRNERGSRRDPNGRVFFHHSSTFNVTGHLWRYQTGYRRGSYTESWDLANINYGSVLPGGATGWVRENPRGWLHNNGMIVEGTNRPLGVKQDGEDWLKTPVRFGETVILNFSETDDHILNNTLEADGLYKFPVYFDPNSGAFYGPLTPERDGTSGEQYTYAMPDDGVLYVRTKMKDAPIYPARAKDPVSGDDIEYLIDDSHPNHQSQSGLPHDPYLINTIISGTGFSTPGPGIPEYKFKLTIEGATRVAAYDPLMAAHLDRIVGASGYNHALDEEQRLFAKFDQIDAYW
jgi:type II secretory pathway pseudopilin PulG